MQAQERVGGSRACLYMLCKGYLGKMCYHKILALKNLIHEIIPPFHAKVMLLLETISHRILPRRQIVNESVL